LAISLLAYPRGEEMGVFYSFKLFLPFLDALRGGRGGISPLRVTG
jgi:hypothetical protein